MFISFEGIDGAGKSSHINAIKNAIEEQGFTVVVTREMGGTPLAEKLRAMVLHEPMDTMTEALLAFAARHDHVENLIKPALASGNVVICDRFTDSTIAYQGYGRQLKNADEVLGNLAQWTLTKDDGEMLQPDLTLWFKLDPNIAAQRLVDARTPDRFEAQEWAFFNRVHQGYLAQFKKHPERIAPIDASQSREDVLFEALTAVRDRLNWAARKDLVLRESAK